MSKVYVIDAIRTPIGKYGGALASVRPDDLLAGLLKAVQERNPEVDFAALEDVIIGAANQAGEDNRNVARMASLMADLPVTAGGTTVNRLCASGLDAIMMASRALQCGDGDLYIAGGVESMSRAPFVLGKSDGAFGRNQELHDTTMGWRFTNKKMEDLGYTDGMGQTAENVAAKYGVTREAQDAFAAATQQKYADAAAAGAFSEEIIPVKIVGKKGVVTEVTTDEHPRLSTPEQLAGLKPAFKKDGSVTAGNSSGINDGASVLLLASENFVKAHNLKPMAVVKAMAVAGVEPAYMGMGPVPAVEKALKRAGLQVSDLDLIELNEAFAAQSIPCMQELGLDEKKVNIRGGAIALGHPLGCSGARISTTLLHALSQTGGKYGIATMCVGVGQGAAVVFENL